MDDLDLGATIKGFSSGQKVFGRYTLKKILGRGGMGVVWLAHDGELEREVALKFLPEVVALDPEALADLKRETRRNLDLTHPHIVRIYDFVADPRTAAISMEYVNGASLSALKLDKEARVFATEEIRGWLVQLTEALTYAHTKAKVVHRDLKPANLMLTKDGDLKITDFGIARGISDSVSRVSAQVAGSSGTPVYMSPQQMMGEKAAVTDDIYALGATLYELLTGKPPFYSGNVFMQVQNKLPPSIAERRRELEVTGEAVPAHWEQAIAACLAKEPADRPRSMAELGQRLGLHGGPVSLPPVAKPVAPVAAPPVIAPAPVPAGGSWFRRWVLVPAGWGFLANTVLATIAFLLSMSSGDADASVVFLSFLLLSWPLPSFIISMGMGLYRARREEKARLAADPALVHVPVLRRWLLAPVVAALPVALIVTGLFRTFEPDPNFTIGSFVVSWPLLAMFSLFVLAVRRPWAVSSPRGITALGMILAAPLGAFANEGKVGSGVLILCVIAAGYLGGLGGWLLHLLAVRVPGSVSPEEQARQKRLHWLRALGAVAAAGIFLGVLPATVAQLKAGQAAVAAQRAIADAEVERLHQEQVREERRAGAADLITPAVRMVFDRDPTVAELADYTALLVEHPGWEAAQLREEMRGSPEGRKGGRLLVPMEFPTIAAALGAAVPGNAVHVAAGTYRENLHLDKAVDLIGAGRDQVFVEADRTGIVLHVDAVAGATISGFTFRHTDTDEADRRSSLVSIGGSSVRFSGNAITAANGHGLWIDGAGSCTVADNLVRGARWSGIYMDEKGSAEIRNNEVTGNAGSGITVAGKAGTVTITGNRISGNGVQGIWMEGGETVTLTDNVVTGNSTSGDNYGGIGIGSGQPVLRGNVVRDNKGSDIWWDQEKAHPKIGPGNISEGAELPVTP